MPMPRLMLIPLAAVIALITGCAPATVGLQKTGIDNVAVVDDGPGGLYRGAQPSREGIKTLHDELHVKTVIDLRDDAVSWEADAVKQQGMVYCRIASDAAVVDPEKIHKFLDTLRSAARPVFIHCRQGRDRTGMELAIYRIVDQGWTRERAIDELYAHGFNHFWFPNIDHYLRTFDPNQFKRSGAQPINASAGN